MTSPLLCTSTRQLPERQKPVVELVVGGLVGGRPVGWPVGRGVGLGVGIVDRVGRREGASVRVGIGGTVGWGLGVGIGGKVGRREGAGVGRRDGIRGTVIGRGVRIGGKVGRGDGTDIGPNKFPKSSPQHVEQVQFTVQSTSGYPQEVVPE